MSATARVQARAPSVAMAITHIRERRRSNAFDNLPSSALVKSYLVGPNNHEIIAVPRFVCQAFLQTQRPRAP